MESVVANPYDGLPLSDPKRWVVVYPAYLNAKKTLAEGRRVPKSKAVDKPLCSEIRDVCLSQQLQVIVEGTKLYCRELTKDHIHIGRVKVQLRKDDGSPLNENITSRNQLFVIICNLIPKLKTRQGGGGVTSEHPPVSGGGTSASRGGAPSKKKKGRRK